MPDSRPSRPLSALPSAGARLAAFVAIIVGGAAGALIGWAFVDVQCTGTCSTQTAIGALVGGVAAAAGTAIVAVLVLRAMGEWHELGDRRAAGDVAARRAAAAPSTTPDLGDGDGDGDGD